ncbi:glycosyltransferase [Martelella sp. AD-3]|uniref:glycosyltransferase n=1 Tax=Martelella sp. AD-3 TaxID=686597 RepID=UPI00056B81F6|nr:glycosyltransferase [Martelella sp. AD-3]AMM86653.1 glycosyl transferase [Martelella sp. AD-3]MAM10800.1 glycosyl transferase [Rhizobiaceae bacterium]
MPDPSNEGVRRSADAKAPFAYVTLVTNADYAMGALALARSVFLTGSPADVVVLYTGGTPEESLKQLEDIGCRMIGVDHLPLSDAFNARHARREVHGNAPFTKGRKPDFHTPLDNFCKLRLWQLVEYHAVVFIDADAIVLKNIDKLFFYPEFSAAPNVYESLADFHRLNSGVFVARPDLATFDAMIEALDAPDAFWRRTDQTFLQTFFPDWHGLPVFMNMLQYVWFNMPELWNWSDIGVLHFQYEKPWEEDHPRAEQLKPLIELWWAYFDGDRIPDIASLENPKKTA